MDKGLPGPMTPFDELVTSPELQILKLIIPYTPAPGRRTLAAFVKFTELKETFRLFRTPGGLRCQDLSEDPLTSPLDILNSFRPYLGPREISILDMFMNISEMMSFMEMMKNVPTDSSDNSGSMDPMSILAGMLSPEQAEMFQAYSDMFSQSSGDADNAPDSTAGEKEQKGDETDE